MKAPVLVVAPAAYAHPIEAAIQGAFTVTIAEDLERGKALGVVGAHVLVVAAGPFRGSIPGAVEISSTADADAVLATVRFAAHRAFETERAAATTALSALTYDEHLELSRYAATRRYLVGLLVQHRGSVTDAARAAGLVRESLHRLLRRHHLEAEAFRDHSD